MAGLRGASDLAGFIAERYRGLVVEVGAGHLPDVAVCLARISQDLSVLATDRESRSLGSLEVEGDDIFSPRIELYTGASLIYSVRPSYEMQIAICALAAMVGADVLILPLEDEIAEIHGFSRTLVNKGEARFYLLRPKERPS